jgi:hypothetical protein
MIDVSKLIPNVTKLVRTGGSWGDCKRGEVYVFSGSYIDGYIQIQNSSKEYDIQYFELYESTKKNHLPVWF